MSLSMAQQAKKYDVFGCSLSQEKAIAHWFSSNFIGKYGDVIRAKHIHRTQGALSVEFADGSILSMAHWSI